MALTVMQLLYMMYGFIGIETLLLVLVFVKTPARMFLIASLQKKAIMFIIGKDNIGYFRTFKPRNGSGYIKGFGIFNLTEGSHILDFGTRLPFYLAFRDIAATICPEYPAQLQELKESGLKINNIEDLERYIDEAKKCANKDVVIKIKPFKTYCLSSMRDGFPFNTDPTFVDAEIQTNLAQHLKKVKDTKLWIIGLGVFLVIAAIATLIFMRAFKGQIAIEDCKVMTNIAVDAARASITPAVQTITNMTAAIS